VKVRVDDIGGVRVFCVMAATGEGVFLYNTLTPLGEESLEDGEDEYISLNGSFLPLESAGSPRGEDSVAEQATSTVTVERQETKFSRNVYQKTEGSTQGTSLQSLIDLESELLVEASTPEFKVRPVPPASAALGVISTVNTFSVSLTNIQSVGSAQVEQDIEESEFISLNVVDENIESVVQETLEFKGKRVEAPEDFNTPLKEVPPWARGRDAWIQSPLLQLHQGQLLLPQGTRVSFLSIGRSRLKLFCFFPRVNDFLVNIAC
jgi:hypothetical protein